MHSPKSKRHQRIALAAMLLMAASAAGAQSVTLNGNLGSQKALLVIDGQPHAVTVGNTVKGVRLVSLSGPQAEVAVDGAREMGGRGIRPIQSMDGARAGRQIRGALPIDIGQE